MDIRIEERILTLKGLGQIALIWSSTILLAILYLGIFPKTWFGAALLVLVGPIAFAITWALGEALVPPVIRILGRIPLVRAVNDRAHEKTMDKEFSVLRVGLALLWGVLLVTVAVGVLVVLGGESATDNWLSAHSPFWNRHFR